MAMLLEMPADVETNHNPSQNGQSQHHQPPVATVAADQAADLLDSPDVDGGDELPPADGEPGGAPFDPDIAASLPESDRPDPPEESDQPAEQPASTGKKKRGRKKKGDTSTSMDVATETRDQPTIIDPIIRPGAAEKRVITRAERISDLTAELIEVVLSCEECESTIDRAKSRLKLLSEQRTELSDELRAVRENESWQPPLFNPPKPVTSEPAGTEAKCPVASSVDPVEPIDAPPAAAADPNPDAWKAVSIDALNLPGKLGDKLKEANAETIGRLENLRAEISQGREKWPPGIGKARVTQIEDSIIDWLSKNRDAAVLAAASGNDQLIPTADASVVLPAVPNFDQWEALTEDQQQEYICARAVILDDGQENCLATKHPKGSGFWDSGFAAGQNGDKVSECTCVPGPEMDDWIRGWLAHGAVEKYEPTAEAAKESKPAKEKPAKPTAKKPVALTSLDDL